MSFVATQAVFTNPRDIAHLEHRTSSFAELTFPQQAPWISSALEQLWNLEFNGRNIEGLGDLRIAANTGNRVRRLLFKIGGSRPLPAPRLDVISGGSISLNWKLGGREIRYIFWPEGVLTYEKELSGEIVDENELSADEEFNPEETVEWLLNI